MFKELNARRGIISVIEWALTLLRYSHTPMCKYCSSAFIFVTKDRCHFIDGETEAHTKVKSSATKAGNGGAGFAPRQSGFRVHTFEMKQVKLTCKHPQEGSLSGVPPGARTLSPPWGQSWREVSENADFSGRGVFTQAWPCRRQEMADLTLGMSRPWYGAGFGGEGETFKAQNKSQSGRLKLLCSAKGTGWPCRNLSPFLSCLSFMEQPF